MAQANTSILWAFTANVSVALVKGTAAWYSGSGVMFAETLHSLADTGNQLLLWLGLARAEKPASTRHPLGHGKELYFWSFIVAVLLFLSGGVLSIVEGVLRWRSPSPIQAPWLAIATIVIALMIEGAALSNALRQVRGVHNVRTFYRWFRDTRRSDLLVIVSEDLAAVLGLTIALFALLAAMLSGRVVFDALGSILIGLLLIIAAGSLIIEVKALLIGESAHATTRNLIQNTLETCEDVAGVEELVTLQYGPDIFIAATVRMSVRDAESLGAALARCHAALNGRIKNLAGIFIEPKL